MKTNHVLGDGFFSVAHPRKTLIIRKINISRSNEIKEKMNILFENHSTYLSLPAEARQTFLVGKKLKGPRYNEDDKVIPHSIVGDPKLFRKNNGPNKNVSKISAHTTFSRISTRDNTWRDLSNHNYLSDNQINSLFSRCRDNINNVTSWATETKEDDSLKTIPEHHKENIEHVLGLQKHNLETQKNNKSREMRIFQGLYNTLYPDKKATQNRKIKLLIESSDNFLLKKEASEYIEQNKSMDERFGNYSWLMGLRHTKKFEGIRKNFINLGTIEHPVWADIREKLPIINERVTNPNWDKSKTNIFESKNLTNYMKNNPKLNNFCATTFDWFDLKVEGKNWLDFEEEHVKSLKGKKRLHPVNYEPECLNSYTICQNYSHLK